MQKYLVNPGAVLIAGANTYLRYEAKISLGIISFTPTYRLRELILAIELINTAFNRVRDGLHQYLLCARKPVLRKGLASSTSVPLASDIATSGILYLAAAD